MNNNQICSKYLLKINQSTVDKDSKVRFIPFYTDEWPRPRLVSSGLAGKHGIHQPRSCRASSTELTLRFRANNTHDAWGHGPGLARRRWTSTYGHGGGMAGKPQIRHTPHPRGMIPRPPHDRCRCGLSPWRDSKIETRKTTHWPWSFDAVDGHFHRRN